MVRRKNCKESIIRDVEDIDRTVGIIINIAADPVKIKKLKLISRIAKTVSYVIRKAIFLGMNAEDPYPLAMMDPSNNASIASLRAIIHKLPSTYEQQILNYRIDGCLLVNGKTLEENMNEAINRVAAPDDKLKCCYRKVLKEEEIDNLVTAATLKTIEDSSNNLNADLATLLVLTNGTNADYLDALAGLYGATIETEINRMITEYANIEAMYNTSTTNFSALTRLIRKINVALNQVDTLLFVANPSDVPSAIAQLNLAYAEIYDPAIIQGAYATVIAEYAAQENSINNLKTDLRNLNASIQTAKAPPPAPGPAPAPAPAPGPAPVLLDVPALIADLNNGIQSPAILHAYSAEIAMMSLGDQVALAPHMASTHSNTLITQLKPDAAAQVTHRLRGSR